jgi:hypothetical protein
MSLLHSADLLQKGLQALLQQDESCVSSTKGNRNSHVLSTCSIPAPSLAPTATQLRASYAESALSLTMSLGTALR